MSSATTARDIPTIKKAEAGASLPAHYSTTPSGTIYSSTPGGSRIIYDRTTLLNLANSPLAKTPPSNLAYVPGVTKVSNIENNNSTNPNPNNPNNNNNNKSTQVEGHLAPPQTLPIPNLQQQQKGNNTNGIESGEDDSHDNKDHHDNGVFAMDME
ncbi:eukaryotic translation initiation factor 4E binding protein [Glomus cerebriforme]|uniref:Eukaryotic translation initiation factor 4E binding protein n=1 Tax=Glomus cerebriforme TaxID=658196 RepID=A0A397TK66_9GLOM|nr:eukaryotic translation initiation factor 4E binding protein [Glomus cerebriforme]